MSGKEKGQQPQIEYDSELATKVASRQVVTTVILAKRLPIFLAAASATGFKVEKIAEEGEEYPEIFIKDYKDIKVKKAVVGSRGFIAISIEKPENSKDHTAFWKSYNVL